MCVVACGCAAVVAVGARGGREDETPAHAAAEHAAVERAEHGRAAAREAQRGRAVRGRDRDGHAAVRTPAVVQAERRADQQRQRRCLWELWRLFVVVLVFVMMLVPVVMMMVVAVAALAVGVGRRGHCRTAGERGADHGPGRPHTHSHTVGQSRTRENEAHLRRQEEETGGRDRRGGAHLRLRLRLAAWLLLRERLLDACERFFFLRRRTRIFLGVALPGVST